MKENRNAFFTRPARDRRVIFACLLTFLATLLGITLGLTIGVGGWNNLVRTAKFAEILAVVEHTYIGEADTETVADAGFSAMIASLNDRWSYYMTAQAYEQYQDHSANRYTGIGITVNTLEDGRLQVMDVSEDSPAARGGITAGLILTTLNGESIAGMTAQELSAAIQEMEGEFTLTALDAKGTEREFTLSTEKIFSEPVSYELLEGNIGYIKLDNFDDGCADGAKAALENLRSLGAKALVFDVRGNGGGYVSELSDLLDALLPEGEIFISVNENGGEKITTSDADCVDLPMAVLVNASSYSAAEYFAAVLQEYDAATVVGVPTTGKGRSQINVVLVDGSAVHISSKRYLTPARVDLSEVGGIVPDVVVEMDETDPQLAAALELFS